MRTNRPARPSPSGGTLALLLVAGLVVSACGGSAQPTATPIPPPVPGAAVPSPSPSPSVAASPVQVAPAAATAPSPSPTAGEGESYTVGPGDTLAIIADRYYGDPTLWRRIYDANRAAIGDNPDNVKVGTVLRIPPKPQ